MSANSLGRLQKVNVRDVRLNEADHFTPWLGLSENLKLLGETIGIELQCEARKKKLDLFALTFSAKTPQRIIGSD